MSDESGDRPGDAERRALVLVNGIPGAGKSTLARRLSRRTGLAHLAKDGLKDYLAGLLPAEPAPAALSALAGRLIWLLAEELPGGVIVETWWGPTGPDAVRAGARRAGFDPDRLLEIWCEVPVDVARRRFEERLGSPGRAPRLDRDDRPPDYWPALAGARPLGVGRLVRIPTVDAVPEEQLEVLVQRIAELGQGTGRF